MSYKKSDVTIQENKHIWADNLVQFQQCHRKRGMVPQQCKSFADTCRMPVMVKIIGRYHFLGCDIKGRKERMIQISKELKVLWNNKLNFPNVSDQRIIKKLENLMKTYDECVKRRNYDVLNEIFDITKVNGLWLSNDDKQLYHLQIQSMGQVGYSTGKLASNESIHPSKRRKILTESVSLIEPDDSNSFQSENSFESSDFDYIHDGFQPSRKYHKSKFAKNLVVATSVSTHKAAKICKKLAHYGISIPTPSQAAIYKATFKEAVKQKEEMIANLQMQQWSLHFDGKQIEGKEYQVVVLKNENNEIKLDALSLSDGKAQTITDGICKVIDEYNLWKAIMMIISDTTNVNTGAKNGVVVKLQQRFYEKCANKPQFVSCQHHVLDRILRLVMDDELGGATRSPNIEYPFVSDLLKNYEELKSQFKNGIQKIPDRSGWRDDMKFLFHLTRVFKYFNETGHFPFINFQKIPNICNARWNSRAILAILAFILIPTTRTTLYNVCCFISNEWATYWFSNQCYNGNDFNNLLSILKPYKKATQTLQNHWKQEASLIHIPRSNQCAERAIKTMQEVYRACSNKNKIGLRFILSNKK